MCGFVGAFDRTGTDSYDLGGMLKVIYHRGPDDQRIKKLKNVTIGFARLAIIDLEGGSQPMQSDGGKITIAMNGEIYNYLELREELNKRGVSFKTNSDTEVLLQMYLNYGLDMLASLQGMFGIVIADENKDEVIFIRDRVGIKPLYYTVGHNDKVGFASEIKPLLKLPFVTKTIRRESVAEFLQCEYVQAPNTIFQDIKKVNPGHYIILKDGTLSEHKYWDCNDVSLDQTLTVETAKRKVTEELKNALSLHLRSDVQLGFFLSGGIDSGLLVALASEQIKNIDTYTLKFENGDFDETNLAQKVAERYGTHHHCYTVKADDFERLLPKILWYFDEPLADSGILPNYMLNELVQKDGTKVILNGAGGDELFAGYTYFFENDTEKRVNAHPVVSGIAEKALGIVKPELSQKIHRSLLYKKDPLVHMLYCEQAIHTDEVERLTGVNPVGMKIKEKYGRSFKQGGLNSLLYTDFKTYLADDLLLLSDRTCMAYSIEGRVPYLHHPLVELTYSIPPEIKAPDGKRKWLLKEIARDYLPKAVFDAPKMGFCSPIQTWANNGFSDFAYKILNSEKTLSRDVWNKDAIKKYVEDRNNYSNHFNRIYLLLILELFFRIHIDGSYESKDDIKVEEIYG